MVLNHWSIMKQKILVISIFFIFGSRCLCAKSVLDQCNKLKNDKTEIALSYQYQGQDAGNLITYKADVIIVDCKKTQSKTPSYLVTFQGLAWGDKETVEVIWNFAASTVEEEYSYQIHNKNGVRNFNCPGLLPVD